MKPNATILLRNYPRVKDYSRSELYSEIGWSDVVDHPAYLDTCATRMSIALLRSGMAIPGATTRIKGGKLKGKKVEIRQKNLSDILRNQWGEPEKFTSQDAAEASVKGRKGIISFFRLRGGATQQGHIDFVYPGLNGFSVCAMACQFSAQEVWFWPLQ